LRNPDFAELARAYGAHGTVVEKTAQFAPAFEEAVGRGSPALLELRIDPDAITTRTSLNAIREKALQARGR
jgi:acetolactate synthase-1/2/3 large subunit